MLLTTLLYAPDCHAPADTILALVEHMYCEGARVVGVNWVVDRYGVIHPNMGRRLLAVSDAVQTCGNTVALHWYAELF